MSYWKLTLCLACILVIQSCKKIDSTQTLKEAKTPANGTQRTYLYGAKSVQGQIVNGLAVIDSKEAVDQIKAKQEPNPVAINSCDFNIEKTSLILNGAPQIGYDLWLHLSGKSNQPGFDRVVDAANINLPTDGWIKLFATGEFLQSGNGAKLSYHLKGKILTAEMEGPRLTGYTIPGFSSDGKIRRVVTLEFERPLTSGEMMLSTPIVSASKQAYERDTHFFSSDSPEIAKTSGQCSGFSAVKN